MAKKEKKAPVREKEDSSAEIIKKFKQNPGVYIGSVVILVLVIVTFVGGDFLSGGRRYAGKTPDLTFGYYDKVPIAWVPGNIFAQQYERTVYNYRAQGYDERIYGYSIWKQAFEGTVVQTAVQQMVKKSGYTPSEKAVNKIVIQSPEFQDNGRFSLVLYNRMTEAARLNHWRQTQEDIARTSFFRDLFSLLTPESEAKFIADMSSPERSFDFVSFKVSDYPESEIISYARNNSTFFNSIHLSKITVSGSEKEAQKIQASINDGTTTFEDAARAQSSDSYADRGGDMGVRYYYDIIDEIPNSADRDMIYSLGRGELSKVISAAGNWVFFRAEEDLVLPDFEDAVVLDRVRFYIGNKERGRMEDWAIEQAMDFISGVKESGIINAVSWRNLDLNSFGPFPLNYGSVDIFKTLDSLTESGMALQDLLGLSQNENFWKRAFSTPLYTPCEPLVQGDNVFVFIPTEEIEADEYSLENIVSAYSAKSIYSSNFVINTTNQSLQTYFMSNGKTEDLFDDAYRRIFQ
jgi:hypothetical protein